MQGKRETTNWIFGFGFGLTYAAIMVVLADSLWAEARMGTATRLAVLLVQCGGIACIVTGIWRRRRESATAGARATKTRN